MRGAIAGVRRAEVGCERLARSRRSAALESVGAAGGTGIDIDAREQRDDVPPFGRTDGAGRRRRGQWVGGRQRRRALMREQDLSRVFEACGGVRCRHQAEVADLDEARREQVTEPAGENVSAGMVAS
ncbi:MAG: hypothetical protein IPI67_26600 [Myxococcales bacterium]|nr:hypothetical protein [Myxococcales bacterium]